MKKRPMGPNCEFHILCNEIRNSEGHGDQILVTLDRDVVKFHNDTVDSANGGLQEAPDGNRPNDLGSLLYVF